MVYTKTAAMVAKEERWKVENYKLLEIYEKEAMLENAVVRRLG